MIGSLDVTGRLDKVGRIDVNCYVDVIGRGSPNDTGILDVNGSNNRAGRINGSDNGNSYELLTGRPYETGSDNDNGSLDGVGSKDDSDSDIRFAVWTRTDSDNGNGNVVETLPDTLLRNSLPETSILILNFWITLDGMNGWVITI
jgi:hypothetical protein